MCASRFLHPLFVHNESMRYKQYWRIYEGDESSSSIRGHERSNNNIPEDELALSAENPHKLSAGV